MSSLKVTGTGRKVIKRACDGCKIRKIKCSEVPPCDGCKAVGIACTFEKRQRARGPRTLRAKTIQVIAQAQQQQNLTDDSPAPETETCLSFDPSPERPTAKSFENPQRTPIAALVLRLCVYRLRLYAVWPIVAVEEVMASLQRDEHDTETYALANAVAAATIAQLKLNRIKEDATSASSMESECQRAKVLNHDGPQVNLNILKISFFLHIYHENDQPGGIKSLLYLREAITLAQIMGLHKESTYTGISTAEQQIRRRIVWLLFVTERGVAMLHKLPVVLKANIFFPSMDGDDESQVLPAFMKLIDLFWIFDKSGAFDILQNTEGDSSNHGTMEPASRNCLDSLQQKLQEVPIDGASTSDVQRADICVTRQWMCALLWKATMSNGRSPTFQRAASLSHPIEIAQDFLGVISKLPNAAIEAHGPTMEFKIYEIATAVTESLANESPVLWDLADGTRDILSQLQRVLASCRGGNKKLISMLCNKIEGIQSSPPLLIEPSSRVEEVEWPIESTASSDQTFDLGLDSTTAPPEFLSPEEFSKDQNERHGYINNFQQIMPHLIDLPWGSHVVETLNTLSPSVDLFEQLQNFNNSLNSAESPGTLDRFLSSTNLWDGSDTDMLNVLNENSHFPM